MIYSPAARRRPRARRAAIATPTRSASGPGGARLRWALLLGILLLAWALRLPAEGLPPGLYHDEAYYGLDALATLAEGPRLWYPANHGREPLFVWALAPSVALLGRTPAALRLVAGIAGLLTVAALWPLGRRWLGARGALLAIGLMAVTVWPVLLSRTALRAVLLPLLLCLAIAATLRAFDEPRPGRAALSGALCALTLLTYTAARALPALWLLALLAMAWRPAGRARLRRMALPWLAAASLVAVPFAHALVTTPGALAGRAAQVTVFGDLGWASGGDADGGGAGGGDDAEEGGAQAGGDAEADAAPAPDAARVLLGSVLRTAGLPFWRGDAIPRHNVPGRPVFGPLAAALWALGLLAALLALRPRRPGDAERAPLGRGPAAFLLAWGLVGALPTALAEDAPHFLRATALLPWTMLLAGLGGAWLWRAAAPRGRTAAALATGLLVLAVAAEAAATLGYARDLRRAAAEEALDRGVERDVRQDAGGDAAQDLASDVTWDIAPWRAPDDREPRYRALYYAYEGGARDLALQLNRGLGRGWRGGWAEAPPGPGQPTWLDRRLAEGWASVPYLVPLDRLTLADPYDPVLSGGRGIAWLQPEGLDTARVWAALPAAPITLTLAAGPREQGDLEPGSRGMAVRAEGLPPGVAPDGLPPGPLAAFEGGLRLASGALAAPAEGPGHEAGRLEARTAWRLPADGRAPAGSLVRLRLVGADGVLDAREAPAGAGVFPPELWRPGDTVVHRDLLLLPPARRPFRPERQHAEASMRLHPDPEPLPARGPDGRDLGTAVRLPWIDPRP